MSSILYKKTKYRAKNEILIATMPKGDAKVRAHEEREREREGSGVRACVLVCSRGVIMVGTGVVRRSTIHCYFKTTHPFICEDCESARSVLYCTLFKVRGRKTVNCTLARQQWLTFCFPVTSPLFPPDIIFSIGEKGTKSGKDMRGRWVLQQSL